ncbi:50S ribosomal protein L9 [Acaryochloris thomasi RCC1774]|uniref:Large ribosomal subunit protein bL9 n=2 Tax=Acaryochloris TaxID=155977 RepID=A0A2W1JNG6_9CYAN|nr:50S ribosomal protein L9 [Acaryochloris thomasi RCC1774]
MDRYCKIIPTPTAMAKRIQLLLNQDVKKLGTSGQLVEVAPGYARNYLIPQGMGVRVTKGVLKQIEFRKAEEVKRIAALKAGAEKQKTALETIGVFSIKEKAGEEDMLFGRVTAIDIADLVQNTSGIELDRRELDIPEIRKLGTYNVDLKLHPEVTATVKIEVLPD